MTLTKTRPLKTICTLKVIHCHDAGRPKVFHAKHNRVMGRIMIVKRVYGRYVQIHIKLHIDTFNIIRNMQKQSNMHETHTKLSNTYKNYQNINETHNYIQTHTKRSETFENKPKQYKSLEMCEMLIKQSKTYKKLKLSQKTQKTQS